MRFFNLLKKEIRELLNAQIIIGMAISVILMVSMGQFFSGAISDALKSGDTIVICDNDSTDFTKQVFAALEKAGNTVTFVSIDENNVASSVQEQKLKNVIIIPEGFTKSILEDKKAASLKSVNVMTTTSMMSSIAGTGSIDMISKIQETSKLVLMSDLYGFSADEIDFLNYPVTEDSITVVGEKSANISSAQIAGFSSTQGLIVPMVIFVLALMASQMIISAISTEKLDKTLETLLTAPVSRLTVLGAKMTAATIVALLNAVVYMIGFGGMMGGMSSSMAGNISSEMTSNAMNQAIDTVGALSTLGLTLSPLNYLLVGLQMFVTLLIALSISLCLGAMVSDAKSTQTVILPMMFAIMIPFMLTMFVNVNELSIIPKIIMYIIPFTHTYLAIDNLIFGNMGLFWAGFAYQVIFFIICMYIAIKLFTSDKLFTASISFGKKKNKASQE